MNAFCTTYKKAGNHLRTESFAPLSKVPTIHHTADDSRLISAFELNLLLELVTEKEVIVERNCLQNYISCHCGGPDHLFAQGPSNLCEILITS